MNEANMQKCVQQSNTARTRYRIDFLEIIKASSRAQTARAPGQAHIARDGERNCG